MAHAKQGSKSKRRRTALPFLGAAGASLAVGGGASAATAPTANVTSGGFALPGALTLLEEELSDVSLGTFYVFDNEVGDSLLDEKVARAGGCGGCRGCAAARGCGGRGCAAVARCAGVARCAVGRCAVGRCAAVARCRCGVGVVGCAGCGCSCSVCTGTCRSRAFTGWAFVCCRGACLPGASRGSPSSRPISLTRVVMAGCAQAQPGRPSLSAAPPHGWADGRAHGGRAGGQPHRETLD